MPKLLPRCEQVLEPAATACPCCRGQLHKIGEGVSEVLDVIPAILRTIRRKYAVAPTAGRKCCRVRLRVAWYRRPSWLTW
ncbi:IS66 family transposase zinc-finger binding domain-containing protein [Bradyrhizobium sp. USDA 3315]